MAIFDSLILTDNSVLPENVQKISESGLSASETYEFKSIAAIVLPSAIVWLGISETIGGSFKIVSFTIKQ